MMRIRAQSYPLRITVSAFLLVVAQSLNLLHALNPCMTRECVCRNVSNPQFESILLNICWHHHTVRKESVVIVKSFYLTVLIGGCGCIIFLLAAPVAFTKTQHFSSHEQVATRFSTNKLKPHPTTNSVC